MRIDPYTRFPVLTFPKIIKYTRRRLTATTLHEQRYLLVLKGPWYIGIIIISIPVIWPSLYKFERGGEGGGKRKTTTHRYTHIVHRENYYNSSVPR